MIFQNWNYKSKKFEITKPVIGCYQSTRKGCRSFSNMCVDMSYLSCQNSRHRRCVSCKFYVKKFLIFLKFLPHCWLLSGYSRGLRILHVNRKNFYTFKLYRILKWLFFSLFHFQCSIYFT